MIIDLNNHKGRLTFNAGASGMNVSYRERYGMVVFSEVLPNERLVALAQYLVHASPIFSNSTADLVSKEVNDFIKRNEYAVKLSDLMDSMSIQYFGRTGINLTKGESDIVLRAAEAELALAQKEEKGAE